MKRWFAAVLAAAFTFILGVRLGEQRCETIPGRQALASALFHRYGNVERAKPSVSVPSGPKTGYRSRAHWLLDADAIITYGQRYPNG